VPLASIFLSTESCHAHVSYRTFRRPHAGTEMPVCPSHHQGDLRFARRRTGLGGHHFDGRETRKLGNGWPFMVGRRSLSVVAERMHAKGMGARCKGNRRASTSSTESCARCARSFCWSTKLSATRCRGGMTLHHAATPLADQNL